MNDPTGVLPLPITGSTACSHGPSTWWLQGHGAQRSWCSLACALVDLGARPDRITITYRGGVPEDVHVDGPDEATPPMSLTVVAPDGRTAWNDPAGRRDVVSLVLVAAAAHGFTRELRLAGVRLVDVGEPA